MVLFSKEELGYYLGKSIYKQVFSILLCVD